MISPYLCRPLRTESEAIAAIKLKRLKVLDRQIDNADAWGACLAALCEERDAIASSLNIPKRLTYGKEQANHG